MELSPDGPAAKVESKLLACNCLLYECRRTVEIHAERLAWQRFRDSCPGGESTHEMRAQADRLLSQARAANSNMLQSSSGHFLPGLAARAVERECAGSKHRLVVLFNWEVNFWTAHDKTMTFRCASGPVLGRYILAATAAFGSAIRMV